MFLRIYWPAIFIVTTTLITMCSNPVSGDDVELGLLRYARWLSDDIESQPIRLVQQQEIVQPLDVPQLSQELTGLQSSGLAGRERLDFSLFGQPALGSFEASNLGSPATAAAVRQATGQPVLPELVSTPPVELIPSSVLNLVNIPDITESIIATSTTPTVRARRRSPISFEPRIRGYAGGQIYTQFDGAFIGPVRNDLDGVLSKVDKGLIGNTEIISGPYGLRHGSGFSFLTIDTIPTPRYERGWENHVRLGSFVRANGGQLYSTATLFGGGERVGYFANVGYRTGSDYDAGNGLNIPSSYEAFNLFSGIGIDINDNTRMVTRFTRLNQGETEYAAQFFDVNDLKHYGLNNSIIHQNDCTGIGYRIDGWISNTDFQGDTMLGGKRRDNFPVLNRVDRALQTATMTNSGQFVGNVNGEVSIAGLRAGVTREFDEETSVGAGADIRYVRQKIDEHYDLSQFPSITDPTFDTGLPQSQIVDPGFYAEAASGMTEYWNMAVGARLAFTSTQASAGDLRENSNFKDITGNVVRDLDVSDILGSWYITNDIALSNAWRSRIGLGYAERLPDLTERYSDGLFLSVIQGGFTRIIGSPELRKERNYQVDLRLDGEYENCRVRVSGFHAWILDYITYSANLVADPLGARLLEVLNTDYATLAGLEAYGEYDLCESVQTFASLAYLDGRDREINQPLSSIYPLESRIGLRWFDTNPDNAWGVESGVRIVDNQDRLGTVRPVTGSGSGAEPITLESETPGFAVFYIRGYVSPSDGINITGGVENLFNRNYYEHLNLRLPADPGNGFGQTIVLSPGITPYLGVEIEY